jgi:hypothetical protein
MREKIKILIKDAETYGKVTKQMDKEGIRWWVTGDLPSDSMHNMGNSFLIDFFPIYLCVDEYSRLSWSDSSDTDDRYSEITPEEYLKEDKRMIKVGDIVRVTDWGCQYSTNSLWFLTHMDDLETEWLINYTYDDTTHYTEHQYNDTNKYRVLYVDEHEGKCLITQKGYSDRVYDIYLIGLKGVELYDNPTETEMTISEIEKRLGIKNLKIVKDS